MHIGVILNEVVPPPKYGGTNRVVTTLVNELLRLGHKVTLYAKEGSGIKGAICRDLPVDFEISNAWIDKSIDILHMHYPHRVETNIPLLVTQHGNSLSRIFPHMSFVSESHAKNHGTTAFVYNGINVEDFPFTSHKEDYLCFLADASWGVKNLRTAIALAKDTKTKLVVMGGKGQNSDYVDFRGMVGEADGKLEILAKAKALIYLANWDEPCGLAVLESLACGTPVIATTNGAFPAIIDASCGRCVGSYSEAVSAVKSIEAISAHSCRLRLDHGFTSSQMTQGYIRLYNEVLNGTWNYVTPSHVFDSPLHKVYKPSLRNFLHFEVKHRLAHLRGKQWDYSYRSATRVDPERCGFGTRDGRLLNSG